MIKPKPLYTLVIIHLFQHDSTCSSSLPQNHFSLISSPPALSSHPLELGVQHFSSDMTSEAVKRIEDARIMRSAQFTQDAGELTILISCPKRASHLRTDSSPSMVMREILRTATVTLVPPLPFRSDGTPDSSGVLHR